MFDRCQHPALGRDGGSAGAAGEVRLDDGSEMQSKGKQWIPDDRRLVLNLPGGGGYGDPSKRAADLVELDVVGEYISEQQATATYGYKNSRLICRPAT
jgi:N-methylhydantoinase B